jgi:hypothetical protein
MRFEKMPKLQKVTGGFALRIPKELVVHKGWKPGTTLMLAFNERGNIEIKE